LKISSSMGNYSVVGGVDSYNNDKSLILCKCDTCNNVWNAQYSNLVRSFTACPICDMHGFNILLECFNYVCILINYDTGDMFVGYGITNYPVIRLSQHKKSAMLYGYDIICWEINISNSGNECKSLETLLKKKFNRIKTKINGFIRENTNICNYYEILNLYRK